ncbi:hypothetical protein CAK95_01490 [Pseudorhodoplanes sinuspersici]|uniref:Tc1-like transposase DDE domain-containing protein n=1 Tax=Pseudorhodoplanes sinuspersici TaxID=1235591 RepID=A0A1W6ZKL7_9HYPH|nr:hypothetical protein CAK95_01490 [Pseudorhodoplanes sinuspersici]
MIKAAGARLWYLPSYSPDLNPMEQTFAKITHGMRADQKRTIKDVWRHVGELLATIGQTMTTTSQMQDMLLSNREPL